MMLHLLTFLLVCYLYVECQPIAQGPFSVKQLFAQANTNKIKAILSRKFEEIFNHPSDKSTSTFVGIPGTGSCTCVPYYLCDNGIINTNGKGLIDVRSQDSVCETSWEVCCEEGDQVDNPIVPPPGPNTQVGCGYRNSDGLGFRVLGNVETQFAEFPWMVLVLREEKNATGSVYAYQCGGGLIHPQMVVTAAHCVYGKNKAFKVRAGEWDTLHVLELYPYQERKVQEIIVHNQYYAGASYSDIALLYLESSFDDAANVKTICLPPQAQTLESGDCYAAGWGKDVFGREGKSDGILKKIDLPIVPNKKCQEQLRRTRLGEFFELHSSFICAGGVPGKDTCKGDGGSFLVCPIPGQKNRYFQMGIVAWGIGCGEDNVPAVYVNVPKFRDWIDWQMRAYNLEISSYQY
ncbi:unnamed protein product [Ceutorhynchus assimilis]|uniref:Phenoloxidase-activating factor 2 n=1 Tax=Ceutorhynchus assimilis TaxID=467358 RepID=A0A9N9ML88_9CUCU|nr:unnamed protein product [Ceutorhynchus assimilis]